MAEMDIEVNLGDVDHEAEDKKAMEAYQEALEAADEETPGESSDEKKEVSTS